MTLKQKLLDYLRTHKEPFTIDMLRAEVGGRRHTINGYMCRFIQDGIVAYAEPRQSVGIPGTYWKPRKYICPPSPSPEAT